MKHLKNLSEEKVDYQKPDTFEDLAQLNVSLGPLRKKLIIEISGKEAELSKTEVDTLVAALKSAQARMAS